MTVYCHQFKDFSVSLFFQSIFFLNIIFLENDKSLIAYMFSFYKLFELLYMVSHPYRWLL